MMNYIKITIAIILLNTTVSFSQENNVLDSLNKGESTSPKTQKDTTVVKTAPENSEENKELNTDVIIVKTFQPILFDIDRTPEIPQIIDTVNVVPKFEYSADGKQIQTNFEPEQILAGKMGNEPLEKLYHTYMRLGVGNYVAPLAEIYFNTLRSKKYSGGAYFKHLASYAKVKNEAGDRVYSGFDNNSINLFGKKIFDKKILYSDINFRSNEFFYYGTDTAFTEIPKTKEAIDRQHFINAEATVGIKTINTTTSNLNYDINLNYNYFADKFYYYENTAVLNSELSKYYNKELIGLSTRIAAIDKNFDNKINTLITATPWASRVSDKWKAKVGLNINFDITSIETNTYFTPNFLLQYNVVGNILIPYVGANGGVIENDSKTIAYENNYVSPIFWYKSTVHNKHFFGGIKGSISSKMSFNVMVAYDSYKDMIFYVNNINDNKFHVEYGDLDYYNFFGEIKYQQSNKLNISLSGNYYYFDYVNIYTETENFDKAWHKPDYSIKLSALYNLKKKIYLHSDVFVMGKRYAKVYDVNSVAYAKELKEIIDVNLGVEYRYSKVLSGFINFNNIAAQRYQKWNNYPVQGFQVVGGITYTL